MVEHGPIAGTVVLMSSEPRERWQGWSCLCEGMAQTTTKPRGIASSLCEKIDLLCRRCPCAHAACIRTSPLLPATDLCGPAHPALRTLSAAMGVRVGDTVEPRSSRLPPMI